MGPHCTVMRPWHLEVHGPRITFGSCVHVVTAPDRKVRLTTWQHDAGGGSIAIGDYALLCPGVRLDSASEIIVGRNSMLAAGVYLTDADWHDMYDRTRPIGATAPVVLEDNVWVGESAVICKGVDLIKPVLDGSIELTAVMRKQADGQVVPIVDALEQSATVHDELVTWTERQIVTCSHKYAQSQTKFFSWNLAIQLHEP